MRVCRCAEALIDLNWGKRSAVDSPDPAAGTGKQATTACTNTHHPDPHSPNILGPHAGFSSEPGDHYKYSLRWRLALPFDLIFVSEEPADGLSLHLHSTRFGCSDNLLGNQTWRDKEGLASTKSEWYQ